MFFCVLCHIGLGQSSTRIERKYIFHSGGENIAGKYLAMRKHLPHRIVGKKLERKKICFFLHGGKTLQETGWKPHQRNITDQPKIILMLQYAALAFESWPLGWPCSVHVSFSFLPFIQHSFFFFCIFSPFQGPSHPVILRANSPATPGTIQDSLPPALPVQRIPNPHVRAHGHGLAIHPPPNPPSLDVLTPVH